MTGNFEANPADSTRGQLGTILLVDDEPAVAETTAAVLVLDGHMVVTATSVDSAIRQLDQRNFDVVLTDIRLDDADGLAIVRELLRRGSPAVAIVTTGYGSLESAVRALREGAYDYLLKPCPVEELRATIARALERRRLRALLEERVDELEQANATIRTLNADLEERVAVATATLQEQAARLRLLDAAGAALASSLDYEVTLELVVRLPLPSLADWCSVDVVDEDGTARGLAAAHADQARTVQVRELQRRFPPDPSGRQPVSEVLRTARSVLLTKISQEELRATSRNAEHLALRRALGFESIMVVPLSGRGRLLGAMTLVRGSAGPNYNAHDLDLAEALAGRCAMAIDNARLYAEARRALRTRDEFLSVAAHELKTPLTAVVATAQLLLRYLDMNEQYPVVRLRDRLTIIDDHSRKLARLVDQVLDVSRLERGDFQLTYEDTDVAHLVRETIRRAELRSEQHRVELRAPPSLSALIDPGRIRQVLENLLDNALRYSSGATVTVEVHAPSESVEIVVHDHGPGIPPDKRGRLFERFYRAHDRDYASGLGLGLSIAREIIQRHRGELTVEYPSEGGMRFVARIPRSMTQIT
jgi:signal transduction histidine kinase/DNA-binding response OmpR family regulator